MFAAQLVADDAFNVCMIVALVLFAIAAVFAAVERALTIALISAGLAIVALGWVIVS
jgi:hypothetical protein